CGRVYVCHAKTKSSAVRGAPSCQVRLGLRRYVVCIRPSGNTRHVSVLSCGSDSARFGCATSWVSSTASSALNMPFVRYRATPASWGGRVARLSGSTRTAATRVRAEGAPEAGALGAAPVCPGPPGAHAATIVRQTRTIGSVQDRRNVSIPRDLNPQGILHNHTMRRISHAWRTDG